MSIEAAQEEFSGDQAGNMHVCMYHIFFSSNIYRENYHHNFFALLLIIN